MFPACWVGFPYNHYLFGVTVAGKGRYKLHHETCHLNLLRHNQPRYEPAFMTETKVDFDWLTIVVYRDYYKPGWSLNHSSEK